MQSLEARSKAGRERLTVGFEVSAAESWDDSVGCFACSPCPVVDSE